LEEQVGEVTMERGLPCVSEDSERWVALDTATHVSWTFWEPSLDGLRIMEPTPWNVYEQKLFVAEVIIYVNKRKKRRREGKRTDGSS
jgi:hypothetical protein